jgi:hypothetical protein
MKKIFMIDGGAGRVITAIPALERYVKEHPEENIKIFVYGWDSLFWSNPILQPLCFNANDKGNFDRYFKEADVVVSPEPYRLPDYYNQKVSLVQAFDILINGDNKCEKNPKLYISNQEKIIGKNIIEDVKKYQNKEKTVIIQPYGSTATPLIDGKNDDVIDNSNRSFSLMMYCKLAMEITKKYNLVLFSDSKFHFPEDNFSYKLNGDLRTHMSAIYNCDYFIGCDSVGQHITRALNKPGTVIFGSTFPVNVSYPDWFKIIDNKKDNRVYSPLRINDIDCNMADRLNSDCMNYSEKEIENLCMGIMQDIKNKIS